MLTMSSSVSNLPWLAMQVLSLSLYESPFSTRQTITVHANIRSTPVLPDHCNLSLPLVACTCFVHVDT